ncbi:MAG: kynureninase [Phycisphaerales bacterium]|nr:kynureninase [Phycisphaerales bacterium]
MTARTATTLDTSEAFALSLDRADPLSGARSLFHIPPAVAAHDPAAASKATVDAPRAVYLTGNSLGLQPKSVRAALEQELADWANMGVEGHLHAAHPWLPYHEELREGAAHIAGASTREVVVMNSLTVNLHILLTAFYRPSGKRTQIMIEDSCFPSDSHAVISQTRLHGLDPATALIRLKPRAGEHTLRSSDILDQIHAHRDTLALVMLGGVNYLTGQWFDMPAITAAAHNAGAIAGWDLAHAAGNVPLKLHEWGADFACWCSYKYLNSGPGAIAGAFVHERHLARADLLHFAGWWGNDPKTRFRMGPEFVPVQSADRFQLSNPPIFSMTPVRESLAIFQRFTLPALREKSLKLTAYLRSLIEANNHAKGREAVQIITPSDDNAHGCQLSLIVKPKNSGADEASEPAVRVAHQSLAKQGMIVDFRSPNVIRAAPVPLYNTFHDAWRFAQALSSAVG